MNGYNDREMINLFIRIKKESNRYKPFIMFLTKYCSCIDIVDRNTPIKQYFVPYEVYIMGQRVGLFDGIGVHFTTKTNGITGKYKDLGNMIDSLIESCIGRIPKPDLEKFILERI